MGWRVFDQEEPGQLCPWGWVGGLLMVGLEEGDRSVRLAWQDQAGWGTLEMVGRKNGTPRERDRVPRPIPEDGC